MHVQWNMALALAAGCALLAGAQTPPALASPQRAVLVAAAATPVAFGADLSKPANGQRTCWGGISAATLPTLAAQQGMTLEYFIWVMENLYGQNFDYPSCTWWNVGSMPAPGQSTVNSEDNVVPYPGGTLTSVKVKTGPVVGRMRVDVLRYVRDATSAARAGGPYWVASSAVFTPRPSTITEIPMNIPVKHELNEINAAWSFDSLALTVLAPDVPIPFWDAGGNPYANGAAGAKYPGWEPGTEQYRDVGALDSAGTVLLQGNVVLGSAPATATPGPTIATPPGTGGPVTQPPPPPPPSAVVKVRATGGKSKLSVDVDPNQGARYWTFSVQKLRADGSWKQLKSYKTRTAKETRKINLRKGTYRVVVDAKHGRSGTTSASVYLKK